MPRRPKQCGECVCARVCHVHGEVRQCVVGAVWYGDASSVWTIYNAGERGRLLSAGGRRRGGGAGMPLRPSVSQPSVTVRLRA